MAQNITYTTLSDAKAFLCWDLFPDLSIQLVETAESTSYFYPPSNRCTIIVFYEKDCADFSKPLWHLFHEAGHYQQYFEDKKHQRENHFYEMMNTRTGTARKAFEEKAWEKGKMLLTRFVREKGLSECALQAYEESAKSGIQSYT